ncbi:hypothetical protein PATSB16_16150 [Pandoraea thiooxydans]|uniref:Aspartate/glutamate racemase family protein n=2 Tax=Pandoraea thiooxydans TaxID=445709 RepID=A0A0U4ERP7_9BURK|nr:hypothetical protein ABW99_05715 [Pandoraea thiooxydans]APR94957.1 hypothetical protein PATSB16_16150 [Pandoraea thiooxydans]
MRALLIFAAKRHPWIKMRPLGILMLDTRFPRPVGDLGNPATFAYPTVLKRIPNASPARVIHDQAAGLVSAFCEGARELEHQGCAALITSCGFMVLHQQRLAAAVSIPVATSSLLLIPLLKALFPTDRKIGVLTASAAALSAAHLAAAGAPADTPVGGVRDDGEFARVIVGNQPEGDFARIGDEVVAAAQALKSAHADLGALVLECTNMRPYLEAIRRACGVPVFDLLDLADLLMRRPAGGPAALCEAVRR